MTEPQTFRELATLARDRCRAANESVIQLLDTDQEAAALMLAVAADMIYGASSYLGDNKTAVQAALNMMIDNLRSLPPRRESNR